MDEKIKKDSLKLKIYMILFLLCISFFTVYAGIGMIRYKLTGKPDLSYWTEMTEENFENEYIACFPDKLGFLNLNGRMARMFGITRLNDIVRLQNGYLTSMTPKVDEEVLRNEARSVANLNNKLKEKNIPLLYVAAPPKCQENNDMLPVGEYDYDNENLNVFLDELSRNDVSYLDMRKLIEETNENYYDFFYVTDHHWNVKAGFFASEKISGWLAKNIDLKIDKKAADIANFEVANYKKCFLGSRGKRVGTSFGSVDDFEILKPIFETSFQDISTDQKGDFSSLLINEDYIKNAKDYLKSDIYDLGLQGPTHVINNDKTKDKSIIFVTDSYGFIVQPYLAMQVKRIDDISAYTPNMLAQTVENVKPDAVVILNCPSFNLGKDASFNFGY